MLRCISKNHPTDLPFHSNIPLSLERTRLLSALLSSRRSLRIVCAPAGYGKTALAYQYASQVFASDMVMWIDASLPAFLLALDERQGNEFTLRFLDRDTAHHKSLLFVIDDCPPLDRARFEALCQLLADLLEADHEVLLTTCDTHWLEVDQPLCKRIDARMLLVDARERSSLLSQASMLAGAQDRDAQEDDPLCSIIGFLDQSEQAHRRFARTMMDAKLLREEDALAIIMLVLERGAVHELSAFTNSPLAILIAHLEQRYPHVGIVALDPMFRAVSLTEREKFFLIRAHLSALVATLPAFEDEEALIEALIAVLLKHDHLTLATQLACGLHDDDARARYFDRHAQAFLFSGRPLLLLQLARTLPTSFLSCEQRWLSVAIANGILGEKEASLCAMRTGALAVSDAHDATGRQHLMTLFVKLAFNMAEVSDIEALSNLIAHHPSIESPARIAPSERPDLSREVLVLVRDTIIDPCVSIEQLLRIAASGFSLKQTLAVTCSFVSLLTFLWRDRLKGGPTRATDNQVMLKGASETEETMLACLERHIAIVLARQVEVLPPNIYALFLFDRARDLFGERTYMLIDDRTLAHIESVRRGLIAQQKRVRADPHASFCIDEASEHDEEIGSPTGKKALRINTLGRFELEPYDPKIIIKDKVRKQMRLLISLLAINEGREVARQRIQRIMWPDASERNARQSLYTTWSLLNKSVIDSRGECPFFESNSQSIALNARLVETDTQLLSVLCKRLREGSLDLSGYERAIDQVEELYRGPLLPGDETAEVVAQRKRYQDRLLEALLTSGMSLRKRGETALALRYFRFAFDNEPTREDICYQLMLSLWKLGRHGEALNEYFVCRRSLIDQFGIEGTSKLRELYETILADASEQA